MKFEWTPACQEAFELLKSKLTSPPVLAHPDFLLPFIFILDTDASAAGIGAVFSQCHSDGKEEVIAAEPFQSQSVATVQPAVNC